MGEQLHTAAEARPTGHVSAEQLSPLVQFPHTINLLFDRSHTARADPIGGADGITDLKQILNRS